MTVDWFLFGNGISKCQSRSFKVSNWHFGLHFGGDDHVASHQGKAKRNPKGIGRKNRKIGTNHQAPHGIIDRTGNHCKTEW